MLVYRTLLDKHKTLNFGPLQREKMFFMGITKGIYIKNNAPQVTKMLCFLINAENAANSRLRRAL